MALHLLLELLILREGARIGVADAVAGAAVAGAVLDVLVEVLFCSLVMVLREIALAVETLIRVGVGAVAVAARAGALACVQVPGLRVVAAHPRNRVVQPAADCRDVLVVVVAAARVHSQVVAALGDMRIGTRQVIGGLLILCVGGFGLRLA